MSASKLPLGIQDFEKLILEEKTYVDKTEYLYQLIRGVKPTFISRPRRFGKSLTVSTLEAIFRGKRELFKGLWIDSSDWDWQIYPVIRLDMGKVDSSTPLEFVQSLTDQLCKIADQYQVQLPTQLPLGSIFDTLILKLSELGKVVVLVDEYDKPLIDQLNDIALAKKIRVRLRKFYEMIKFNDEHIKFVFLTGVTKFSKVSVFSGLNNLNDITLSGNYSGLMGYTKEELKHYFADEVKILMAEIQLPEDVCSDQIKEWYNGYQFSEQGVQVYNPFSVLKLFEDGKFHQHWFETGTPTFVLDLLTKREFDPQTLEHIEVSASGFQSFEIENIPMLPLLYQTGYLTIKSFDPEFQAYTLGYPNREVSQAFTESLITYFTNRDDRTNGYLVEISRNLKASSWNFDEFFTLVKQVYALIPYDLYIKQEAHYHSLFYLLIKLAGININAEFHTQRGRADACIELSDKILIFELKLNESAAMALAQIKARKYYEIFSDRKLPLYLVGVNFDGETRSIDDFIVEILQS